LESETSQLELRPARHPADWVQARALVEAYAAELGVDLSFQGFDAEVVDLAGAYPAPGGVWLAWREGTPLGCVALRELEPGVAELKRLFVVPAARGSGLGRRLVEAALGSADSAGFRAVRLDTLPGMRDAQALYLSLGFHPVAPYRSNPVPGAQFLERSSPGAGGGPPEVSPGSTR
jgi:putative acetyltransferase